MFRLVLICVFSVTMVVVAQPGFYGHRGCRGVYPENSLVGFRFASALNIAGIELDVVVNKEKKLVVSHEAFFRKKICKNKKYKGKKNNLYHLNQDEIAQIDCGCKGNNLFRKQNKISTTKPLFSEFVQKVDLKAKQILMEVKSFPSNYEKSQPLPGDFADIVVKEIEDSKIKNQIIVMSFDSKFLNSIHTKDSTIRCILLTYFPAKKSNYFLKELHFKPFGLGLFHRTLSPSLVKDIKKQEIKVYTWTVNNKRKVKKLIRIGVDAIITDYPDRFNHLVNQ